MSLNAVQDKDLSFVNGQMRWAHDNSVHFASLKRQIRFIHLFVCLLGFSSDDSVTLDMVYMIISEDQ